MTKPRIVLLNPTCMDVLSLHGDWIASLGVDLVVNEAARMLRPEQIDSVLVNADALILPAAIQAVPHAKHMKRHGSIKMLSIATSGYDQIDIPAATRHGIIVTNTTGREGADVVAEMTFGLMLAVARRIPHHDRVLRAGKFERGTGTALVGKTLGIVGLGHIGKAVARRAIAFGMRILATTRNPDLDFVKRNGIAIVSLEQLLRRSDFVSLHVRLNAETMNVIGAEQLRLMKPGAFLINTARQALVDEAALTDAVIRRQIAGVGLDDAPLAKDSPLLRLPNVVCTPHLGNRTIEGMSAVLRCAVENALAVLRGELSQFVLNPEV